MVHLFALTLLSLLGRSISCEDTPLLIVTLVTNRSAKLAKDMHGGQERNGRSHQAWGVHVRVFAASLSPRHPYQSCHLLNPSLVSMQYALDSSSVPYLLEGPCWAPKGRLSQT